MSDELIDYLDEIAAIEESIGSVVAKAALAALPGYTQRIQTETLRGAADDLDRTRYSHGEPALLGMVVARDALRARAAALAAPVEPTCICTATECHGAEDHGGPIVCRPCLELDPERDCLAAPPVEQP